MGRVLSIVSQKGGVGKTTTAVNLAVAFARRGLKTLLIDADPQGAVRYGVGLRRGHPTVGFDDYLRGEKALREVILPTALPWLRVILFAGYSFPDSQTNSAAPASSSSRRKSRATKSKSVSYTTTSASQPSAGTQKATAPGTSSKSASASAKPYSASSKSNKHTTGGGGGTGRLSFALLLPLPWGLAKLQAATPAGRDQDHLRVLVELPREHCQGQHDHERHQHQPGQRRHRHHAAGDHSGNAVDHHVGASGPRHRQGWR